MLSCVPQTEPIQHSLQRQTDTVIPHAWKAQIHKYTHGKMAECGIYNNTGLEPVAIKGIKKTFFECVQTKIVQCVCVHVRVTQLRN